MCNLLLLSFVTIAGIWRKYKSLQAANLVCYCVLIVCQVSKGKTTITWKIIVHVIVDSILDLEVQTPSGNP